MKVERSLKVFLACFLGAGIGALVALQMGPWYWWTGAGIGFLVGYLSYEFEAVRKAFSTAWRVATVKRELDFPPIVLALRVYWQILSSLGFTIGIGIYLVLLLLMYMAEAQNLLVCHQIALAFSVALGLYVGVNEGYTVLVSRGDSTADELLAEVRELSASYNPLRVYPLAMLEVVLRLLSLAWEVLRSVFRTIHSEIRLLCGVDAAIGAVIGYFLGNAILGATIGGVLGVVDYELISRRLLRLVP